MHQLSEDEKRFHFETWEHIHNVRQLIHTMQKLLGERAMLHDLTKVYDEIESPVFASCANKLDKVEYGSPEYYAGMRELGEALRHHYETSSHHPESFTDGVDGMTLLDIFEMLCDWKASTLRSKNGDIYKSIEIQKKRFGLSDQLVRILKNTVPLLE